MSESDFREAERYLPDFKASGFREMVLARATTQNDRRRTGKAMPYVEHRFPHAFQGGVQNDGSGLAPRTEKKKILEFQNISKSFVGVKALSDVSFSVREGEVHALLGENGAGKSTLMKILSGAYMKDAGKVFLDGQEIQVKNTKESERLGISIIYQELNLIPELSVAENIFLDRQPKRNGFIDWKQMNQDAEKILEGIDMKIPPKMIVSTLSVAQRQMVEIAKAVSLGARLVIMDEPTSTLTEGETRKLFQVISR